jgi:glycosyltransferase EpsJ
MPAQFSIIIPVYNVERYLNHCLDSIIAQSYTDLEIILIDDGSTDKSGEICDSYAQKDKRIKVIHQKNSGVSAARNAGIDAAAGCYISFVDSDDWISPDMYETIAGYIANDDIDILRFNAYRKGELINELPFSGKYAGGKYEQEVLLPFIGSAYFGGMFMLGVLWLHVFRREIIEQNHIRFNTGLRRCEDRLFTLTAALHAGNMFFTDKGLYHYEIYEESLSNRYDPLRWQQELIYLGKLKEEYSQGKGKSFVEEANKRVQNEYLLRAVTSINNEFFSNNPNSFASKYRNTRSIVNHPEVEAATKNLSIKKMGLKGKLTLIMIKYKLPLPLCFFNIFIKYKNKIQRNG